MKATKKVDIYVFSSFLSVFKRRVIDPVVGNFHHFLEVEASTHGSGRGVYLFVRLREKFRHPLIYLFLKKKVPLI